MELKLSVGFQLKMKHNSVGIKEEYNPKLTIATWTHKWSVGFQLWMRHNPVWIQENIIQNWQWLPEHTKQNYKKKKK